MIVQPVIDRPRCTCTKDESAWISCMFLSAALLPVPVLSTHLYSSHLKRVNPGPVQQDLFLVQPCESLAISAAYVFILTWGHFFIAFFKREREEGRDKHWCRRENHWLVAVCTWTGYHMCPDQGPKLQPLPWRGREPTTLDPSAIGWCSDQLSLTGQGSVAFLKWLTSYYLLNNSRKWPKCVMKITSLGFMDHAFIKGHSFLLLKIKQSGIYWNHVVYLVELLNNIWGRQL